MVQRLDLKAGTRFGRLVLVGEEDTRNGRIYEKCVCDCGNTIFVSRYHLTSGKTKSCGCLSKDMARKNFTTHGLYKSRICKIFYSAKQRCENSHDQAYPQYGGRGIKCIWNSFEEFYADMGPSYEDHVRIYGEKETTIDRIDVNGNYCKENCRWATRKIQSNNRRSSRKCEYKGKKYISLRELCEDLGLNYNAVRLKINRGRDLQKAIETPIKEPHDYCYKGKHYKSIKGIADKYGIKYGTVRYRIDTMGRSWEKAIETPLMTNQYG